MLDASRGHHVAYPLFFVRLRCLVVPHTEHESEGTPLFFLLRRVGRAWAKPARERKSERRCGMRVCVSVSEIVEQITRTIEEEKSRYPKDERAEFFFRGERKNYDAPRSFGTRFDCFLDRNSSYVEHERDIYEDALRLNAVSFKDDRTMCDRLARMQLSLIHI